MTRSSRKSGFSRHCGNLHRRVCGLAAANHRVKSELDAGDKERGGSATAVASRLCRQAVWRRDERNFGRGSSSFLGVHVQVTNS